MAEPADELTPQQRESVEGVLAWMQETLGVHRKEKIPDNDWMLIVKLHAMIETGLNAALLKQFAVPELASVIAKLDTSNTATGKIAFAKALKILEPKSAVFVQKLSELRNLCVHDVRNFEFQLDKHLDGLSDDKRNELVKPVMKLVAPESKNSTSFREALWIGVMQIMMELLIHDLKCRNRDLNSKLWRLQSE